MMLRPDQVNLLLYGSGGSSHIYPEKELCGWTVHVINTADYINISIEAKVQMAVKEIQEGEACIIAISG